MPGDQYNLQKQTISYYFCKISETLKKKPNKLERQHKDSIKALLSDINANLQDCSNVLTFSEGVLELDSDNVFLIDSMVSINANEIIRGVYPNDEDEQKHKKYGVDFVHFSLINDSDNIVSNYVHNKKILDKNYLHFVLSVLSSVFLTITISSQLSSQSTLDVIFNLNAKILDLTKSHKTKVYYQCEIPLKNYLMQQYLHHENSKKRLLTHFESIKSKLSELEEQQNQLSISSNRKKDDKKKKIMYNVFNINIAQTIESIIKTNSESFDFYKEKNGQVIVYGDNILHVKHSQYDQYLEYFSNPEIFKKLHEHRAKKMEVYCFSLCSYLNVLEFSDHLLHSESESTNIADQIISLHNLLIQQKEKEKKEIVKLVHIYKKHVSAEVTSKQQHLLWEKVQNAFKTNN
ncbi:hypothetical protein AB837_00496 [bacterium AB1]|nr:hypothetical protein AB837_00496 [bacterium AB1]